LLSNIKVTMIQSKFVIYSGKNKEIYSWKVL